MLKLLDTALKAEHDRTKFKITDKLSYFG